MSRSLIPTSSYTPSVKTIRAVRWPKLCWPREEHYQFKSLTSSSLWRGASLARAGRKFAASLTYFASFVQSPCHLRSRPTREPCTLPSDTGIQSLIHSSSRLRSMLAPAHFTRRTCEMARRSMGLQFAIHFRVRHTDQAHRLAKGRAAVSLLKISVVFCDLGSPAFNNFIVRLPRF